MNHFSKENSFYNNDINNFYNDINEYNFSKINSFFYNNNCNNNILINIINSNNNNSREYNYNFCKNNNYIFNNINDYNNNIITQMKNANYTNSQNQFNIENLMIKNQSNNTYINNLTIDYCMEGNINHYNLMKNDNLKKYNLEEFIHYIDTLPVPLVNFLCTSKGILEIQRKLEKLNNEFKIFLIAHLNKNGLIEIMKNKYGNYFFQRIIKDSDKHLIALILSYISDNFIDISKNSSGTFSLQALLDQISSPKEEQIILKCIKDHEMEMAYDKNATYVLQKIILLIPDFHRLELNNIILNNIKDLCLDPNGICLIKNFIRTNTLIGDKNRINYEFVKNFMILAESPYGNYGIQFLIENWSEEIINDIRKKIIENIFNLSIQQFSSNVVEKAIEIFDGEYRNKIIKKLCLEGNFLILLKSKFGRFVLYKAVNYMNSEIRNDLENKLLNNINNNKDNNKIKKFLIKLQHAKNYNEYYFKKNHLITNDLNLPSHNSNY